MSDTTQGVRRIRALLTPEDVQKLVAAHVADHANVDLTSPDVAVELIELRAGIHAAEVIINVRAS